MPEEHTEMKKSEDAWDKVPPVVKYQLNKQDSFLLGFQIGYREKEEEIIEKEIQEEP